ncbi:hypothetical protein ILUMI_04395 [Ignelater luminosus]|uniref:Tyrosine-protein kinase receptor n=1 Tax=Ignelater luminosus TaxID=2038154 RepID=A0A8K0GJ34_IGNLU|nr:hypothetical protein ILUMI_04395 [Ignelater luminosus]
METDYLRYAPLAFRTDYLISAFVHSLSGRCVTENECLSSTILNDTWWIFNDECVNTCPPKYMRVPRERGWCYFCDENCKKVCTGETVTSLADAQTYQGCTYINGSLSIKIDSKSTADELEANFGMIEEIEGYLKIHRSHPLTTLEFFKKLRVIHGKTLENRRHALIVFENQNLHKLWNWDNFTLDIRNGTISFHYNPQLCLSEIKKLASLTGSRYQDMDVSPYSNGDKTACNYIDLKVTITKLTSTNVTLTWEKYSNIIGYLLYYIEDPTGNITIYDERDECDTTGWNSIFTPNSFTQVTNLKPYTQYAYYIKTYNSSSLGSQTHIKRFVTLSDDPSVLLDVKVISTNDNSVTLSWKPPRHTNGLLSFYDIVAYYEEDDDELLLERNYCDFPQGIRSKRIETPTPEVPVNTTFNTTCCAKEQKLSTGTFDTLCDKLETVSLISTESKVCKNYMYSIKGKDRKLLSENNTLDMILMQTNDTRLIVKPLRHYAMYVFVLRACNSESPLQCSSPIMISQRTSKKDEADDIPPGLTVTVKKYDAFVKWSEPRNPNSLIVSYHIQHNRIDLQHSQILTECITRRKYMLNNYGHQLGNFLPGKYSLKVKAFSLAGGGRFSESVEFEIYAPSSNSMIVSIIAPIIIVIFITVTLALVYYYYHRRKHRFDHLHLITNVNPDYAGPTYIEDEWEMDREDLIVSKELGQGTFGMVYSGFIKSKNRPCAVKTINEHTNVHEKMVFLNEASVMKSFSEAHHVVKLLGVVSKGEPPLVVMELMARGDLKSFLRRSRDSSTTITCAEMYRMAAEIADGMMYLAAKKFVHRDLAARNCMVAADHTVKIGDFGMTRDIYETDYYRKESRGLMPVRWMAPESLADGVFTTDSDVWSYGVVLWEMATLAEQPYQGLANEQVLQFVIAQGTLERPPECPDLLYEIIEVCFRWRPNNRPRFEDIVEKLEPNIGQNFRLVSFYHSAGGEEYRMNTKTRVYNPPALAVPLDRNKRIRWKTSEEDLSLYSSFESNRPTPLLSSIQHQSKTSLSDDDSYR